MQKFTVSPVALTNAIVKIMRELEAKGNSLIAIYALCPLNAQNFGNIPCTVSESETIVADAKKHVLSLNDHKAVPANSEIIRQGRMLQKMEQSNVVAILITQQPVNEEFIQKHSLTFVSKSSTSKVKVEEEEKEPAEA